VADVLDSLVSSSCYKPAWPLDKALAEVYQLAGSHLDPHLVKLLQAHQSTVEAIYTS
jgi:response regulator RpfG family c-di-GMP phosphodiesterase